MPEVSQERYIRNRNASVGEFARGSFETLLCVVFGAVVNNQKGPVKVREGLRGESLDVFLQAAEKAVDAIAFVESRHDDKCVYYCATHEHSLFVGGYVTPGFPLSLEQKSAKEDS